MPDLTGTEPVRPDWPRMAAGFGQPDDDDADLCVGQPFTLAGSTAGALPVAHTMPLLSAGRPEEIMNENPLYSACVQM